jgi:hypothetical protein
MGVILDLGWDNGCWKLTLRGIWNDESEMGENDAKIEMREIGKIVSTLLMLVLGRDSASS